MTIRNLILFILMGSLALPAAAQEQESPLPDAYPWQLPDLDGTINRTDMSNQDWNQFERLESGKTGSYFTWDNWPAYVTMVGDDSAQQLYSQTFYRGPSGHTFNFGTYDLEKIPAKDVSDLPGILYTLGGSGSYKKIYSRETGKPIRSFYGFYFCASFDPFWLFAGDTSYSTYDLDFTIEDVGGGQRVLKDQSGHYPYWTDGSSTRGNPICGKGTSINDPNKFRIKRLSQVVPSFKAFFPLNSSHGACDTDNANCGQLNHTSYTTDRFGRADQALAFGTGLATSNFLLSRQMWEGLPDKQTFSVGFWARLSGNHVAPDVVRQDGSFDSIFFGTTTDIDGKPHATVGLSFADSEQQLALNRTTYPTSTGTSRPITGPETGLPPPDTVGAEKPFDWKFWLPPEFNASNPSGHSGSRWVYFLLSYDANRTTVYMHDPLKTGGDFLPRYTHKYFILMSSKKLLDLDGWGFGNPGRGLGMGAVEAIDDVTVFDGALARDESLVRSVLNEAVLGNAPRKQ